MHIVNRKDWPPGPWDQEPADRWEDRAHGFPILALRNDWGAWCGYVGIPAGHPWRDAEPDDDRDLDVFFHGGITYCAPCDEDSPVCHVPRPGEPDDVLWFGFDTGHAGDMAPSGIFSRYPGDVYRTQAWVQAELVRIAGEAERAR